MKFSDLPSTYHFGGDDGKKRRGAYMRVVFASYLAPCWYDLRKLDDHSHQMYANIWAHESNQDFTGTLLEENGAIDLTGTGKDQLLEAWCAFRIESYPPTEAEETHFKLVWL